MQLTHVGGTYGGNRKPTKFMCLVLKMPQIQPEKEIILEFIKQEDYKSTSACSHFAFRALHALRGVLRLTGQPADVYKYLEPLCMDFRKLRHRIALGWELRNVDEFTPQMDELLVGDYSCDIALPRTAKMAVVALASGVAGPSETARQGGRRFVRGRLDDEAGATKHDEPPGRLP